jgi:hypothetical protein
MAQRCLVIGSETLSRVVEMTTETPWFIQTGLAPQLSKLWWWYRYAFLWKRHLCHGWS